MLSQVHEVFAWFVVAANAIVGCWAIGADRYPALRGPWLWRAIGAAYIATFVQVGMGVALFASGTPITQFHTFYGFLCVIAVAIIYAYRNNEGMARYRYLLFGFGSLFIMGLALRAISVGS